MDKRQVEFEKRLAEGWSVDRAASVAGLNDEEAASLVLRLFAAQKSDAQLVSVASAKAFETALWCLDELMTNATEEEVRLKAAIKAVDLRLAALKLNPSTDKKSSDDKAVVVDLWSFTN